MTQAYQYKYVPTHAEVEEHIENGGRLFKFSGCKKINFTFQRSDSKLKGKL